MIKIRKGTFETNSSSTHSIVISKNKIDVDALKGRSIEFNIGEYGWEFDKRNFPDYLYTAIAEIDDKQLLDKLKSILDKWGVKYKFGKAKYRKCQNYRYLDNGYIDHSCEVYDIVYSFLNDEDLLARALFGDSCVYTGNDNYDDDNAMCYVADDFYRKHPARKDDNYDYFFKGN